MKKLSYINAEAYPAGEMKHGPNALIAEGMPVVVIATCDWSAEDSPARYQRTISNIKEAKARGATIMALVTEGDREVRDMADHLIVLPQTNGMLSSILEVSAAIARLPHRRAARLRRGTAAQPGKVGHRGMKLIVHGRPVQSGARPRSHVDVRYLGSNRYRL